MRWEQPLALFSGAYREYPPGYRGRGGGPLLGRGTCLIQGFPKRLFSLPLIWLGRKGKKKIQVA